MQRTMYHLYMRLRLTGMWIFVMVLAFLILISLAIMYTQTTRGPKQIACTLDAQLCPDGSAVGRVPPHCDFAPCPTNVFCGGIAGIKCPGGLTCKLDGKYPDAGGTCVKF